MWQRTGARGSISLLFFFFFFFFLCFSSYYCVLSLIWWWWWWSRASCPRMSVDILGTNCDHCGRTVQCCFTFTETVRVIRTESLGRPLRLSYSSWTLFFHTAPESFDIAFFFNRRIQRRCVLTVHLVVTQLVSRETAANLRARSLCTIQLYTSLPCHFIRSHIYSPVTATGTFQGEWPESFTCYCGNTGVEGIPK